MLKPIHNFYNIYDVSSLPGREPIDEDLLNIGTYQIVCKESQKRYIGSTTTSFAKRFYQHENLLNRGAHTCKELQAHWAKYGSEKFLFLVFDVLPIDDCRRYEQYYFNITDHTTLFNTEFIACRKFASIEIMDEIKSRYFCASHDS